MPSDKQTRKQRHQTQVKTQKGKAIRGAESVEFVKGSGYKKTEFVGGKKFYTPMSSDPSDAGGGGDVTNVTVTGGGSNVSLTTVSPILGGETSPITDTGIISHASGEGFNHIPTGGSASSHFLKASGSGAGVWSDLPIYMPSGPQGGVSTGVVNTDDSYDINNPSSNGFQSEFLRKDGVFTNPIGSLNTFGKILVTPFGGSPTFLIADQNTDTFQFNTGSSRLSLIADANTDAITIDVPLGTSTSVGVVKVSGGDMIGATYSGGTVTVDHDTISILDADNSGTTFIQDLTFDNYGHVTARTSASIPIYMPSGPEGGVDTGVVDTGGDNYDASNPSNNGFNTEFLRKDGIWSSPVSSIKAFKTISWTPVGGTPFTTVADATADSLTITAGTGIQVALTSADHVTISNSVTNTWRGIDDSPVNGQTGESISSNWAYDHTANASAHHSRYTDSEAVSAMEPKADDNPLNHDKYSHPTTDGNWHVPAVGTGNNGSVLRAGNNSISWDGETVTDGANTLEDNTNPVRFGIFQTLSAKRLHFYTLEAGNNITLTKEGASGGNRIKIAANDAPGVDKIGKVAGDGITEKSVSGGDDTLKIFGGTGIDTTVTQSGSVIGLEVTADVGIGSTQVAAGNHTHTGYEPSFTKNTAFNKNFGTSSGTVSQGNHTHSYISSSGDDTMLGTLTIGSDGTDKYYNRINNNSNWLVKTERSDGSQKTGLYGNGFKDLYIRSNNSDVMKLRDDSITVYDDVLPSGNKTLDLGSATKYFDNVYSEGYKTVDSSNANKTGQTPSFTLRVWDAPSSGSGFGSTKYDLTFVNGLLVGVTPVMT